MCLYLFPTELEAKPFRTLCPDAEVVLGPKIGLSGPYLGWSLIYFKNMFKPNLSTISLIFMYVDIFM